MRHGIAGNKLGRNQTLRKATVRDIAKAALIKERVCTTKAKAKEARKMVDRLITLGKKGQLAHKRRAFSILCNHKLVSQLFSTTAPRFANRSGGYTRIIPLERRRGDNAELVYLELTELSQPIVSQIRRANVAAVSSSADSIDGDVAEAEVVEEGKPVKSSVKPPKQTKKSIEATKDTSKQSGIKKIFQPSKEK